MSRFWNKLVHKLHPYVPGEQPQMANLIKLNTNESPYSPSPRAIKAIATSASDRLRLYPDPEATSLRQAIAEYHGLSIKQVFAGNGSDEVLAHAFRGFFHKSAPVLFADVSYGFYPVYCKLFSLTYKEIPLREDFHIAVTDYTEPCGGIVIANPNANTGIALPLTEIRKLLEAHPERITIIDEAYVDFGAESAASLLKEHDNLLVVRTFSKSSGLAGLRVGYALGTSELIEGLMRVKDSFNSYPLSRPALEGAEAALRDRAWMAQTTQKIIATRTYLAKALQSLGIKVLPSSANFLLVHHPDYAAHALAHALREKAILVRHLASTPRIAQWLRITIGTDEECQRLIEALREILTSPKTGSAPPLTTL